jgi:hypothetical protein
MQPIAGRDASMTPGGLIEHYEAALGPLDGAWAETADDVPLLFKLLRFPAAPMPGAVTYATLGLSDRKLRIPGEGLLRQELVISCYDRFAGPDVVGVLHAVGAEIFDKGEVLPRGRVLGPAGPLFPDTSLTALYVSMPVVFPDQLYTYSGSSPDTVIAWLVPISTEEADIVRRHGWSEFEDLLEAQDPDLFDLHRPSVVCGESG